MSVRRVFLLRNRRLPYEKPQKSDSERITLVRIHVFGTVLGDGGRENGLQESTGEVPKGILGARNAA